MMDGCCCETLGAERKSVGRVAVCLSLVLFSAAKARVDAFGQVSDAFFKNFGTSCR